MRWILPFLLVALPVCLGCNKSSPTALSTVGSKIGGAAASQPDEGKRQEDAAEKPLEEFVVAQGAPNAPGQPPKAAEVEVKKPRKIRYTADMKLIVEKLDEAEEALDEARKEAKGDYEKAEVNRSANTVRSGLWRVRVPVDNLMSFRKAVAKIGELERDTLESEDITAKYHDLDAHITNRKIDREGIREFVKDIGKKDARYREVMRELEAITDEIDRKEGQLRLWKNLTDLTTFTIHIREKQPYVAPAPPSLTAVPTFGVRAEATWNNSWDKFVGFCQIVAIVAIAVTPWLPIPLVLVLLVWVLARFSVRAKPAPAVVEVIEESPQSEGRPV